MPRGSGSTYVIHGGLPRSRPEPPADAVGLTPVEPPAPRLQLTNLKALAALFVLFLVVVSETFVSSVLAGFGEKAVVGRDPTAWGTVLQGIFLVLGFVLALYLGQSGVV